MSETDVQLSKTESALKNEMSKVRISDQVEVVLTHDDVERVRRLPYWLKFVPTIQQWCMGLAGIQIVRRFPVQLHEYFALKNIIYLTHYFANYDYFNKIGLGSQNYEFNSYHHWGSSIRTNYAVHVILQLLLTLIPGVIILLAAITLRRLICLASVLVGLGAAILRLADYLEFMYLTGAVLETRRLSINYDVRIMVVLLEDFGVRFYIIFCAWRLYICVKGKLILTPRLCLIPMVHPTVSLCPSTVIHHPHDCPCCLHHGEEKYVTPTTMSDYKADTSTGGNSVPAE